MAAKNMTQTIKQIDPNLKEDIIVYTFSNGRIFKEKQNKGYN